MSDDSRGERRYHVDGEIVPASAATVSVEDRGFAYGDAAFETLRAYGGEVFRWDDHAARLADTCETLGLDHGLADADLKARINETLAANDLADAYVKLSITRGVQPGTLDPRPEVVHGKPSTIAHDGAGVFAGLSDRLRVGRYHSLCVEREDLPDELVETARTEDEREVVMGVRHREKPHVGVQFHPESILTPRGKAMVENFVEVCGDE